MRPQPKPFVVEFKKRRRLGKRRPGLKGGFRSVTARAEAAPVRRTIAFVTQK